MTTRHVPLPVIIYVPGERYLACFLFLEMLHLREAEAASTAPAWAPPGPLGVFWLSVSVRTSGSLSLVPFLGLSVALSFPTLMG